MPDSAVLPSFATRAGLTGADTRLLVDPTDAGVIEAADRVVFTGPDRALAPAAGKGVVYTPVEAPESPERTWRTVATAAVCDLGGVVAEIVRLDPGADRLVVFARAVDERGAPESGQAAVLYVGDLLTDPGEAGRAPQVDAVSTGGPAAASEPAPGSGPVPGGPASGAGQGPDVADHPDWRQAQVLDLALGLLGADDVVVAASGRVATRAEVEDLRSRIQKRVFQAPTLAEQAHRQLPLL